MKDEIKLLDVVALTTDVPQHNLHRGKIGAVVECYADGTYDVEFVAQDGYLCPCDPTGRSTDCTVRKTDARCPGCGAGDSVRLSVGVAGEASGANSSGGLSMRSLHIRAHVDKQSQVTFTMPPEFANQDVDLVVVFEPLKSAKAVGWPPGFFARTASAWQGEPLTREPQGEYGERDSLG